MPVKSQLFVVSKFDQNIVTDDRQAKVLVEEAKAKEALIKSVTPANAGIRFVEFSGAALPSVGYRPSPE